MFDLPTFYTTVQQTTDNKIPIQHNLTFTIYWP